MQSWRLRLPSYTLHISTRATKAAGGGKALDATAVVRDLRYWAKDDPLVWSTLGDICRRLGSVGSTSRHPSRDDLIAAFSRALASGRLVAETESRRTAVALPPQPEEPPAARAERPVESFDLQVVWDDSGDPVATLPVVVQPEGASYVMRETDRDGRVSIDRVPAGRCETRCSFDGLSIADCVGVVGRGEVTRTDEERSRAPSHANARPRAVVTVNWHKVASGDSLDTLAQRVGMSGPDLARFNFGTSEPRKINEHLEKDVGCTVKTADGANYVFDDSDEPGLVALPKKWSLSLETGRRHVLRVKPLALPNDRLVSTLALEQFAEVAEIMEENEFLIWVTMLFGADIPEQAYRDLRSALLDGSFPNPEIRLVDGGLQGHEAAYDSARRRVLVSRPLARAALDDGAAAWKLAVALLEEFGHHVDHLLRNEYSEVGGDAPLDEGVRMAYALVNLGWADEERAEFAKLVDGEGERPLEVEFTGMKEAIDGFLNAEAEADDGRSGDLEFFGAGRGTGTAWSYGHESIEDTLAEADFNPNERRLVYFGNWLRDNSQIVDPKVTRKPGDPPSLYRFTRESLTSVMDVLARESFGDRYEYRVTPARLGVYRNEEHIDNPWGIEDARSIDPDFRGACLPVELQVHPQTHMKRYIRSGLPTVGRQAQDYRVKDGDSLESVAAANGLTWQELAQFNFGTAVPTAVNEHLRREVGCTKRTLDGRNYIFTSADSPGVIRIPGGAAPVGSGEVSTPGYVTAMRYIEKSLRLAVMEGQGAEGFRLLGQGLHTLEDYFAHTNFLEVTLWHLGFPVEPWVPRMPVSTAVPITSGSFGGLDTAMSLLYVLSERLSKETPCVAGEQTAGSRILMILLKDAGWTKTRAVIGGVGDWYRDLEKRWPTLATLSCNTIGMLSRAVQFAIGVIIRDGASQIDDAQTAFEQDPTSTNPTHSQLAKDHDDHPLHVLASKLAGGASRDVATVIKRAWRGEASADDVVAAASSYILHPALIAADSNSSWVLKSIGAWARSNPAGIKQLSSRSWSVEWSKAQKQRRQELQRAANERSGNTQAEQDRAVQLLQGGGQ